MRALAVGVFSMMLVGIVANAVLFQKSRHPAPLFSPGASQAEPAAAQTQTKAPAGAATPPASSRTAAATAPRSEPVLPATPDAAGTPAPAKRVAAKPLHDDGIGRLLQAAAPNETGSLPEKKPDAALRATQKQLLKLGYAVKPDGFMTPATRHAVEKFERDRHLKPGVELTAALRHEIAAAAAPGATPNAQ